MAKTNLIAGLDVGSEKLTAVAAAHDEETNFNRHYRVYDFDEHLSGFSRELKHNVNRLV